MSYSEGDKLRELSTRLDVLERVVAAPTVSKRDIRIIVIALVILAAVAVVGILGELFLIAQIDSIYSLLESV